MKIVNVALLFILIFFQSLPIYAESSEQIVAKINRKWVEKHNAKIPIEVQKLEKVYAGWPNDLEKKYKGTDVLFSDEKAKFLGNTIEMKDWPKYHIPLNNMTSLYQLKMNEKLFLVAAYAKTPKNDSSYSDIYLKVDKVYKKQFHSFDSSPIFVKLGEKKTPFISIQEASANGWSQIIYNPSKKSTLSGASPENNFERVFGTWLWHGGYALYKDLFHDGYFELVCITEIKMPYEVVTRISKKLHISTAEVEGVYPGPWGGKVSIYKWNGFAFKNLGDFLSPY